MLGELDFRIAFGSGEGVLLVVGCGLELVVDRLLLEDAAKAFVRSLLPNQRLLRFLEFVDGREPLLLSWSGLRFSSFLFCVSEGDDNIFSASGDGG